MRHNIVTSQLLLRCEFFMPPSPFARPGSFKPWAGPMGFVVDKETLRQAIRFHIVSHHSINDSY